MDNLKSILSFKDTLPFLFIGSGFTRRYLNTPNWEGLLRHFCSLIDSGNPLLFHSYKEEAIQQLLAAGKKSYSQNDLNSTIADIIEKNFNKIWFVHESFAANRKSFQHLIEDNHTPFKIEIAEFFKSALSKQPELPEELEKFKLLSSDSIAGIITTNYDCLIEKFFDFTSYIGQEQLLFSSTQNFGEIYKIHGCVSSPKSIVIDSADYDNFASRSKYLASKLLTIFVEHPIIFIGYSITDENIRTILDDIIDCLNPDQLALLKKRFIFIEMLPANAATEYLIDEVTITSSRKEITMTRISLKNYGTLYELLSHNHTQYPVKLLRKLKQRVYDLVTTTEPTDKLKIMLPFDQMDDMNDIEFVLGVGIVQATELAYSLYSAEDIYMDVIFDNGNFNSDLLIEKTLPVHLSRTSGSMPFYKYLADYGKPDIPPYYLEHETSSMDSFFNNSIRDYRSTDAGSSVKELAKKFTFPRNLYYIVRLPLENIDAKELHEYLSDLLSKQPDLIKTGKDYPNSSDIRRLIKLYDWMTYYPQYKKKS